MERFLHQLFTSGDRTDDFRRLRNHLYIVATNLNTGESVRFGEAGRDHVPISRAVVASAALPGLYPAVEIEGELYVDGALIRTMNASLALEAGCGLVICINPLVPFDASRARGPKVNVADGGLPAILGQTFRSLIHSRMQVGMASYRSRFPAADILLFEPDRHDAQLFFVNAFRYADRRRLVNHAYQATRRDLLRQSRAFGALLRRHGLRLRMDVLRDRTRTFLTAATERTRRARDVTQHLDHALSRLERALASLES
jgi:predicted acylesterase/phospholipase RssA